jgi:hypothetical protein
MVGLLNEYHFDIKHIGEKENKVVDALNKRVHEMHVTTISMCKFDLRNRILEVVTSEEHYLHIKDGLQQESLQKKYEGYKL